MKTFISLSALFLSLSLTSQTNPATWYLNDSSGSGIQSDTNTASGTYSTAMGRGTTASGDESTAMGENTTASDYASLVIGQHNLLGSTVTNSATAFSTENTAFVIGNGADADNRSDMSMFL